jgi:hypothetical protein
MQQTTIATVGLVMAVACAGCRGGGGTPMPRPTTNPLAMSGEPGEQPLPRPEEGLAYLNAALKDKTRLIEVFYTNELNKRTSGRLGERGRKKLREEVPKWWQSAESISQKPKQGQLPFRVTPDMGLRIYPPGSVDLNPEVARAYMDLRMKRLLSPDVEIFIFRARRIARVHILDPSEARLNEPVFVISSPAPMDWVNRLLGGKL